MCCKNLIVTNKILDKLPKSIVIMTICTFEVTKNIVQLREMHSHHVQKQILKQLNVKQRVLPRLNQIWY